MVSDKADEAELQPLFENPLEAPSEWYDLASETGGIHDESFCLQPNADALRAGRNRTACKSPSGCHRPAIWCIWCSSASPITCREMRSSRSSFVADAVATGACTSERAHPRAHIRARTSNCNTTSRPAISWTSETHQSLQSAWCVPGTSRRAKPCPPKQSRCAWTHCADRRTGERNVSK